MPRALNKSVIKPIIQAALAEDIGMGDLTTDSIFTTQRGEALLVAKADGIFGGFPVLEETYYLLNDTVKVTPFVEEGEQVFRGKKLASISGLVKHILTGERVALNFIQRISGIATLTAQCVALLGDSKTKIIDTRKTIPGLRVLDKYAVRLGGGYNHRFGLFDSVLIKDNHISGAGGITRAVELVRKNIPITSLIEVEAKNLAEVEECLLNNVDIIMLDNMTLEEMMQAIILINSLALVEISGGVTKNAIPQLAHLGADFISIGALTHSAPAMDISLLLQCPG
jgi:nicotinate-nucleotide pyrophosphorylase (carboxylating)